MIEGVTTRVLTGIASHQSSRPAQRPLDPAGAVGSGAPVGGPPSSAGSAATQPSEAAVQQLAADLGAALSRIEGDFSVSVDRDSGMLVVRITDEVTGEIVKQIPPRELLEADRSMERIIGLLVDDKA